LKPAKNASSGFKSGGPGMGQAFDRAPFSWRRLRI
jgi:hypothetical protein